MYVHSLVEHGIKKCIPCGLLKPGANNQYYDIINRKGFKLKLTHMNAHTKIVY